VNETIAGTTEIRHTVGAGGALSLRNVSGTIRVVATDADEAVVRVTSGDGRPPHLNVERSAGSLLVEPERAIGGLGLSIRIGSSHELDFEVEAPRRARIDIKTVSGDIDVRDMAGEQHYKTVSGDVRLTGAAGRISAVSVSGDVRLHEGGVVDLDGATTSGDVTAEATDIWVVGVRTVSGDVRVAGRLRPGPRHAVETVSGDLILEPLGGVTIESRRALDFSRKGRMPVVFGDGSARLVFRSMSGEEHVRAHETQTQLTPPSPATPPTPTTAAAPATAGGDGQRLAILRALERGEIDVDEAARRLEEVTRG
jgi:hypothetical protein